MSTSVLPLRMPVLPVHKVLYEPRLAAVTRVCLEREVRRLVSGLGPKVSASTSVGVRR